MRGIIAGAALVAAAIASPASAAVDVTVSATTSEGSTSDPLNGAKVTSTSGVLNGFTAEDAFGSVTSNPPYPESLAGGHVIFNDGPTAFINFETAAPVLLSNIAFYLSGDGEPNSTFRAFSSVSLFGGTAANALTLLGTATGLPAGASTVNFAFNPQQTLQFFRFEGVQDNGGGRVLEIDGAVPEPSTWLTMILGFGLLGGMLRRRKSPSGARLRTA